MTKPYHILIAPAAERFIRTLSSKQYKLIVQQAEALAINPRPPFAKKLDGMTGLYTIVIDHCQMTYKIEDQEILILVVRLV